MAGDSDSLVAISSVEMLVPAARSTSASRDESRVLPVSMAATLAQDRLPAAAAGPAESSQHQSCARREPFVHFVRGTQTGLDLLLNLDWVQLTINWPSRQ